MAESQFGQNDTVQDTLARLTETVLPERQFGQTVIQLFLCKIETDFGLNKGIWADLWCRKQSPT